MPLPLKHAAAAAAAAILAAAFAAPQLFAKPSSYLGMGAQTGSPSGDVRAAIKSDSKKSDLIMSRPEPAEGGALAAPSAEERPAILNGLALSRPDPHRRGRRDGAPHGLHDDRLDASLHQEHVRRRKRQFLSPEPRRPERRDPHEPGRLLHRRPGLVRARAVHGRRRGARLALAEREQVAARGERLGALHEARG
ncbi:MAG: hypothetical protein ACFWTZ_10060 [Burkholderia sp.]